MQTALMLSCNTAFAQLAHELGEDKVRAEAAKFGIGESGLTIPMPVVTSCIGPRKDGHCLDVVDDAALYQTGIGQRDVSMTPLQDAVITAAIANGGVRMRPQLIRSVLGSDLSKMEDFSADEKGRVMSNANAGQLRDMMKAVEGHLKGGSPNIASKTGTAETGSDPKNTPPFAWYVAFAPADNPTVAVAVMVESREVAATGGSTAASIGRTTINAALGGG